MSFAPFILHNLFQESHLIKTLGEQYRQRGKILFLDFCLQPSILFAKTLIGVESWEEESVKKLV